MSGADFIVEIDRVSRSFGDLKAVDDASLSLRRGDFLTILGPSGCGKTTLLRLIAGFDRADRGRIAISGRPMADVPPEKRSIGMVFQRLALFPHMTAGGNIAYPLKMRGFDKATIPDRVADMLDLVRLGGYADRRPHQLSGGQQQRVAIARALAFGPDLLLLDEPLSALDKKLREDMQLEFRRIQQELGVTTINVTHDQREALVMSDRVVVMERGVIQQDGPPETLYQTPANRFVAHFIGTTSLLRGRADGLDGARQRVRVGDAPLLARGGAPLHDGQPVECAIRAEQIRILDDDLGADGELDNVLRGVVRQRIFEGDRVVYEVSLPDCDDVPVRVFDTNDGVRRPEHSAITLGWRSQDFFPFPVT